MVASFLFGVAMWAALRGLMAGYYTVQPNERAVLTTFGRAERVVGRTTMHDPALSACLRPDERARYDYPQVKVIDPGLHWKLPWQHVHKVTIATRTVSIAFDPEADTFANQQGVVREAVTKDQLNIGLTGQLRFAISERNLYAYLFAIKNPVAHIMGYFISILRDRLANFDAPRGEDSGPDKTPLELDGQRISINDLRKHLRDLNARMNAECAGAEARYGIAFDAALITGIDPPHEVEVALAAINTAHNQVSSEISLAQATADQTIVMSRRAVEIATLSAEAEAQPLLALTDELEQLHARGPGALQIYMRTLRLPLLHKTRSLVIGHDLEAGT
jgi:regulator of protease activity HflC (stomatin/prohibitin superfamily)